LGDPLTLCLITDRKRLLSALGEPASAWFALLLAQVEGAVAGHVDVVQIREPDLTAGELRALTAACVALPDAAATRFVVNDRLDVAIATGAAGVHLRESSFHPAAVRPHIRAGSLLGRSVHSAATALQVAGHPRSSPAAVDYLIAGSVFASESKPAALPLGLDGLAAVVRAADPCPVWAVGGITPARIPSVLAQGVQGCAAIGAFIPSSRGEVARKVQDVSNSLRFLLANCG
jgi:thiamine-phosphate pyrophosphorylase